MIMPYCEHEGQGQDAYDQEGCRALLCESFRPKMTVLPVCVHDNIVTFSSWVDFYAAQSKCLAQEIVQ